MSNLTKDDILPFYIAICASQSKDPNDFFTFTLNALDKIIGSSYEGKSPDQIEVQKEFYKIQSKARMILDEITTK